MAKSLVENQADFNGEYGAEAVPITFMTNTVTTTIVNGLTATLSANKTYWVDGALVYTVTIENTSGDVYSKGVLADQLDTAHVAFDTDFGVEIDGVKTSDYTFTGGALSVNLPDLKDGATMVVTFRVTKA